MVRYYKLYSLFRWVTHQMGNRSLLADLTDYFEISLQTEKLSNFTMSSDVYQGSVLLPIISSKAVHFWVLSSKRLGETSFWGLTK